MRVTEMKFNTWRNSSWVPTIEPKTFKWFQKSRRRSACDFAPAAAPQVTQAPSAKAQLPTQRENLKRVFDGGVPVVMGTDTGFFGVVLGVATQIELALMVETGMAPDAVLRSATINAARMIGRDKESGSIEAGKVADLLVLDANPLEDIRNIRRISRVIKGGVVHEPAQLLSAVPAGPPGPPGR